MATSFKRLPKWEGDAWDGRLPEEWSEIYLEGAEPLPRPTEAEAATLLDSAEFSGVERASIINVARAALGPRGEFSDVFDARRVAFLLWLQDNDRLQAGFVSDEDLDMYLASRAIGTHQGGPRS